MTALVDAQHLVVEFASRRGLFGGARTLQAVRGVSLSIAEGKTVGIVGESGCGKSTLGRALLGLVTPKAGSVRFDGQPLETLAPEALRKLRRQMQLVFQDPYAALNPRLTIGESVREPLDIHRAELSLSAREDLVKGLLERVGLGAAHSGRLPSGLSGGQRQRVVIARALAAEPRFVVADEPVSALDVSIQAQILNLLDELRRERKLTLAFISHDLRVVRHVSDEVVVMYLGRVVERAAVDALFAQPAHPYTKALRSAVPDVRGGKTERVVLEGEPPSPLAPPKGCAFLARCPLAKTLSAEQRARCQGEEPELKPAAHGGAVACHYAS
jgi:oligopeptide/dipeptide ABC transporter ATP-binding protein